MGFKNVEFALMDFRSLLKVNSIFLLLFLIGCASTDFDSNNPESLFKYAQKLESDERYEECLAKYEEVKNRFPYNKLATEAELRIADVQFKKEAFLAAAAAYSNFRELHPNHSMIPYVTYQIGLSNFNALPSTIDRDISGANNAIKEFSRVSEKYPNSEYAKSASDKSKAAYEMLAQKEIYIANFYFIRDQYLSALKRFENALAGRPSDESRREAYYGAGISALEIGERTKGKEYLDTVIKQFPGSNEANKAKSALGKYGAI